MKFCIYIFSELCQEFQIWLKSESNTIHIRGTPMYIYYNISLNSVVDREMFQRRDVEKSFISKNFPENHIV